MKIETKEVSKWKKWMSALSKLVDDIKLGVNQEGIEEKSPGTDNTYLVELSFSKDSFEKYSIDRPRNIALNADQFSEILQSGKGADSIIFSIDKEGLLDITFTGDIIRSYSLPMLSATGNTIEKPDLDITSSFSIKAGTFLQELKNISLISERFLLKTEDSSIGFHSSGGGQGSYDSFYDSSDLEELEIEKSTESVYQFSVIEKLLSSLDRKETVDVRFSTDLPMIIESRDEKTHLLFLRAPVIRQD